MIVESISSNLNDAMLQQPHMFFNLAFNFSYTTVNVYCTSFLSIPVHQTGPLLQLGFDIDVRSKQDGTLIRS